jgi:hypothetical protein
MLGIIASTAAVASATLQQPELQPAWHPPHAAAHTRSRWRLMNVRGDRPAPAGGAPAASPRPRLDPWSLSSRTRVSAARSTRRHAASASAAALARALSSRSLPAARNAVRILHTAPQALLESQLPMSSL